MGNDRRPRSRAWWVMALYRAALDTLSGQARSVGKSEGQLDQAAGGVGQRARQGRVTPAGGVHLGLDEGQGRRCRLAHVLQCYT